MLKARCITKHLVAKIGEPAPPLSQQTKRQVDAIWESEMRRQHHDLFNGQLFSVAEIKDHVIIGWLAEYRLLLAQRKLPELFNVLRVRPLAVTGFVMCGDGVVIGKRAENMTQDPGTWELVPSGIVDDSMLDASGVVDFQSALRIELLEEIGVPESTLQSHPVPFVLVEDESSHVTDVGIFQRISATADEIALSFGRLQSQEHVAIDLVAPNSQQSAEGSILSPVSQAIFAHAQHVVR